MKDDAGYAGLTCGQYRLCLLGYTVPLMAALFGIVFPGYAMATGGVRGAERFVLVPAFALGGWFQAETAIAGGQNAAWATAAKRRLRGLLVLPLVLIPLALVVSAAGLLRLPARAAYPAGYGMVAALIGGAFLLATDRARRIPWLRG